MRFSLCFFPGFGLQELFRELSHYRVTARIDVVENTGQQLRNHMVLFENGQATSVETSNQVMPLGEILRRHGGVSPGEVPRVLAEQASGSRQRVGDLLLAHGGVHRETLAKCLQIQNKLKVESIGRLQGNVAATLEVQHMQHVPPSIRAYCILTSDPPPSNTMPPNISTQTPMYPSATPHRYSRAGIDPQQFDNALHARSSYPSQPAAIHTQSVHARYRSQQPRFAEINENPRMKALVTLGLTFNATDDDIKRTFRKLAAEHHPDRYSGASPEEKRRIADRFSELSRAYHILVS